MASGSLRVQGSHLAESVITNQRGVSMMYQSPLWHHKRSISRTACFLHIFSEKWGKQNDKVKDEMFSGVFFFLVWRARDTWLLENIGKGPFYKGDNWVRTIHPSIFFHRSICARVVGVQEPIPTILGRMRSTPWVRTSMAKRPCTCRCTGLIKCLWVVCIRTGSSSSGVIWCHHNSVTHG